jgi:hypothetical protein
MILIRERNVSLSVIQRKRPLLSLHVEERTSTLIRISINKMEKQ